MALYGKRAAGDYERSLKMVKVAIDIETSGLDAGFHDILEIGVIVLDEDFNPTDMTFNSYIKPLNPIASDAYAMKVNGLDIEHLHDYAPSVTQVKSMFIEWFEDLFTGERVQAVAHNAPFEISFLKVFFNQFFPRFFHYRWRDTQTAAALLRDAGVLKVPSTGLDFLSNHFGIIREKAHTALDDAKVCALVYQKELNLIKTL